MSDFKRKKILIVEDTDTVQIMMRRWVSNAGFDVAVAHDGREALEKVKEEIPDMVLLDVMMPEMNGFEVCRKMRSIEAMKKTPIIIVTGLPSSADSVDARMSGANEVLIKPVLEKELVARIKHYFISTFKEKRP